jgi:hypothetical protein
MAVDLSFFRSETSQRLRAESRAEGLAVGLAVGRAEALLLVLQTRGLELTDAVRERITGCSDLEVLRGWLGRAVSADRVEEIFGDE